MCLMQGVQLVIDSLLWTWLLLNGKYAGKDMAAAHQQLVNEHGYAHGTLCYCPDLGEAPEDLNVPHVRHTLRCAL